MLLTDLALLSILLSPLLLLPLLRAYYHQQHRQGNITIKDADRHFTIWICIIVFLIIFMTLSFISN